MVEKFKAVLVWSQQYYCLGKLDRIRVIYFPFQEKVRSGSDNLNFLRKIYTNIFRLLQPDFFLFQVQIRLGPSLKIEFQVSGQGV